MISEGSAFLDRAGRLLGVEDAFRACLGLGGGDPTVALQRRADADPALRALLAGEGPDEVRLEGGAGLEACDVTRVQSSAGFLLRARGVGARAPAPLAEYAMQAATLVRLAGSVAHEVKNPLNAMALQLALLGDKIATASDALATSCAGNLGSLKNQIGRVNEVIRRFVDCCDPTPARDFDAGGLMADCASLFGHEARRRRIALTCDASPDAVWAAGDPARAARLLLGLVGCAVAATPEGGRVAARVAPAGGEVALVLEHGRGDPDPSVAWMVRVVAQGAAAMNGRLESSVEGDVVRVALMLPRERPL